MLTTAALVAVLTYVGSGFSRTSVYFAGGWLGDVRTIGYLIPS